MNIDLSSLTKGPIIAGGAAQSVYNDLREKIINIDLPPGKVLSRSELTEYYGVSLTPLRDALQLLHQEGLVQIWPQSRTIVTQIDINEMRETHFLRVAIENEVVRSLALIKDDDTISKATSIVKMQEVIANDPNERKTFQELDNDFHLTLFKGVGRANLHQLIVKRSGNLSRARNLHLPEEGRAQNIVKAHQNIIKALKAADPDKAVFAMREHLSQTISHIETLRKQYYDYFKPVI